jgi:hypothetical protein
MREERLGGWGDLTRLADKQKGENWFYRGVTRCDYALIPKIGRPRGRNAGGEYIPYDENDERRLFEEFKRQARPMVTSQPENDLEWMALAQHHGLKTRLLDWTESLLVAAMFATESGVTYDIGRRTPNPPAIYGIRNLPVADDKNKDPFGINDVKVFRPAHISPRIAPQQAVFTVHPRPQEKLDSDDLVKWILDINGTIDMKLALDAAGISRAALFPGIDGLADGLNWRHKWNVLRG